MNTAEANLNPSIDLVEFKARYLEVLEHLVAPGLIVTKDGRLLARITPVTAVNNESLIGSMKGQPREHQLVVQQPLAISDIVLWELAKLIQLGRITLDLGSSTFQACLQQLTVIPISLDIARAST